MVNLIGDFYGQNRNTGMLYDERRDASYTIKVARLRFIGDNDTDGFLCAKVVSNCHIDVVVYHLVACLVCATAGFGKKMICCFDITKGHEDIHDRPWEGQLRLCGLFRMTLVLHGLKGEDCRLSSAARICAAYMTLPSYPFMV